MNTCTFTVILPSVSQTPYIFFCPFRLSLVPTICPWVSEDGQTLNNLNLELTQCNFFPSDHLYMFHLFLNNHVNSLSVTGVQIQCPFLQALLLIIPFSKNQSISLTQGLKVVCMVLAFPPSIWLFYYFWLLRLPTTQTRNKLNFFWTSLNWRFVLLGVVTVFSSIAFLNFSGLFFSFVQCALVLYLIFLILFTELNLLCMVKLSVVHL